MTLNGVMTADARCASWVYCLRLLTNLLSLQRSKSKCGVWRCTAMTDVLKSKEIMTRKHTHIYMSEETGNKTVRLSHIASNRADEQLRTRE